MTPPSWHLRCIDTGATYPPNELRYRSDTGGLLEIIFDLDAIDGAALRNAWDDRRAGRDRLDRSGVWRFRELLPPLDAGQVVTRTEGDTPLWDSPRLSRWTGIDDLLVKHEGANPTGSFKDRGMTVGVSAARWLDQRRVACASTGNTSASLASYAAVADMQAVVFIPAGKIAQGKLSQALAYGARVIQIDGDFDAAMALVEQVCSAQDAYLLNSLNPFRLEGQKTIAFELAQQLDWRMPDWLIFPGGNLGNNSAAYKGLRELRALGLIERLPRIAVIQAAGAAPLFADFQRGFAKPFEPVAGADTLATAIRIGDPVSWQKSREAVQRTCGVVAAVTDDEIMDAKAHVDGAGIGAEPASCASVAGARQLRENGTIGSNEQVVCVLTGHLLKDPDATIGYHAGELPGVTAQRANRPVQCPADPDAIREVIDALED